MNSFINALPGAVSQGLIWGIMAIGLYITYRVLEVSDLTVDGSFCTGGCVCVMAMIGGCNVWVAMLLAMLAGMLTGYATGFFHTKCGIPAILAGILTQLGLWSVNLAILGMKANQGINVNNYDLLVSLRYLQEVTKGKRPFYDHPIVVVGLVTVGVIAILYWFFGTELGCAIRATGANSNMSRAQGINTDRMKLVGLVLANGLVGLSGGLYTQYLGSVTVNMGRGAIVIGLAAVIIGEVLLGKIFRNFALRMTGVVIGAIAYYVVIALVIQLGLNTDDLKLFSAAFVAVALYVPYWKGNHAGKNLTKGGKNHA